MTPLSERAEAGQLREFWIQAVRLDGASDESKKPAGAPFVHVASGLTSAWPRAMVQASTCMQFEAIP
jgi:hypothetical protein